MQKKWSFDRETVKKILKGAVHALYVSALIGLLDYALIVVGAIESNNVLTVMFQSWFMQSGYQTLRQYIKGK